MTEPQDDRPMDVTDDQKDETDGVSDHDDGGPLDDETPGSQGEIEAGSEGDFGRQDEPR